MYDNECNVTNCEYNTSGKCLYCGDYWSLNNSKECLAYEEVYTRRY